MDATDMPYNTVSSIVRKLEAQGYIGYEAFGKSHRYYPILELDQYRKTSLATFLDHYFNGQPANLLSYFVEEEQLSKDELSQLLNNIKDEDHA